MCSTFYRMQQWRNQFVHLALIWLEVLTKQANQWILSAANKDKVSGIKSAHTHSLVSLVH